MKNQPYLKFSGSTSLNESDSLKLVEQFSVKEIKEAVFDCGDDKAPGPDGFNFRFIKQFWKDFEDDFFRLMQHFHVEGKFGMGVGSSFITLVPKIGDPTGLADYHPINLTGVISKVVSKVLANRLKRVMEQIRFPALWCKWVKGVLESVRSSVLVNGSSTFEFNCQKGIRQGDPASPFLFLVVMEALSGMIKKACLVGAFDGVRLPNQGLVLSHLLYADDGMIMGEWLDFNFDNLKRILRIFYLCSGLKINIHKSVVYGVGVTDEVVNVKASLLGCKAGALPFVYLGIKVGANTNRVNNWEAVIDIFRNRLSKWKVESLSIGGRVVLIKSWIWRYKSEQGALWRRTVEAIHGSTRRWDMMSSNKRFRRVWKNIVSFGNKVRINGKGLSTMLRGVVGDGLEIRFWYDPWLNDHVLKDRFPNIFRLEKEKTCCVADRCRGSGEDTIVSWSWNKLPETVAEVQERSECEVMLQNVFMQNRPDQWQWAASADHSYSVGEVKKWLRSEVGNSNQNAGRFVYVWCKWVPNKCNIFMWRAELDRLPTKLALRRRSIQVEDTVCSLCGEGEETVDHLFTTCSVLCGVWSVLSSWCKVPQMYAFTFKDLMVPLVTIQEALPSVWREGVYLFVNLRQRIAILRACLVEISIINAHSPSSARLFHHYWVRDPTLITYFPQDSSFE
ncbi:uncharacterized protein LOC110914609 [Helianthus annuus]|uniref:uncharacterized protein LOC110914609 n=1 Tax=Helianthus annuus TaxID=4232 RepID=UPI000B90826C|nr:uncharacterized protein LOC110914609 [Helianthus annuus]